MNVIEISLTGTIDINGPSLNKKMYQVFKIIAASLFQERFAKIYENYLFRISQGDWPRNFICFCLGQSERDKVARFVTSFSLETSTVSSLRTVI